MLVAALSSCHMLWFLTLAAKRRWSIDRYADAAIGVMEPNAQGRLVMARVTLRPDVGFSGKPTPTAEQVLALHHEAHAECFIANSVKAEVMIDPGVAS
jgi:organic hydroperoxide reductase OsmC/OhrA